MSHETYDWIVSQLGWWLGMIGAVCVALYGQADIQEPWRHYLSIGGLVGAVGSSYMLKQRKDG